MFIKWTFRKNLKEKLYHKNKNIDKAKKRMHNAKFKKKNVPQ